MHIFELVPFALCLASLHLAPAQDAIPYTQPRKPFVETSISLGTGAQLTATRVNANILESQSLDPSATLLGSVRQSFRPWLGYSANFGYDRTTEENARPSPYSTLTHVRIPYNTYEVSLAYLAEEHITPKITGFASLGGGILGFLPVHRGNEARLFTPSGNFLPSYLSRPLGIASVGLDVRLSHSLALRAEYRGLLYKLPDDHEEFGKPLTETSQPTVSLVYRFGGGKH